MGKKKKLRFLNLPQIQKYPILNKIASVFLLTQAYVSFTYYLTNGDKLIN
jgi:hypothetical protein